MASLFLNLKRIFAIKLKCSKDSFQILVQQRGYSGSVNIYCNLISSCDNQYVNTVSQIKQENKGKT